LELLKSNKNNTSSSSSFSSSSSSSFSSLPSPRFRYALHKVVVHEGELIFGHYFTFVRKYKNDCSEEDGEKKRKNEKKKMREEKKKEGEEFADDPDLLFWCLNDEHVSKVNWDDVQVYFIFFFCFIFVFFFCLLLFVLFSFL
jgi:hypothetical protein